MSVYPRTQYRSGGATFVDTPEALRTLIEAETVRLANVRDQQFRDAFLYGMGVRRHPAATAGVDATDMIEVNGVWMTREDAARARA